jgi:plasmid stabilization system protein ParE
MRIVYHPEASRDLEEMVDFYQERRMGLGARFFEGVTSTLEHLSAFPEMGRLDLAGYRVFRVSGFPINLLYKAFPSHLFVVAVAHQRRKQGFWLDRDQSS